MGGDDRLGVLRLQVFLEGSAGLREAGRAVCLRIRFIPGEKRRRSLLQLFIGKIEAALQLQQLGSRRGQKDLRAVRLQIRIDRARVVPGFLLEKGFLPCHIVAQQAFQKGLQ